MAHINSHKLFALKSELDLFTTKQSQNCVETGYFHECRPVSILDSDSPIEFYLSESDDYIDPAHTKINLRIKILNEDGTPLARDSKVVPVNNFLCSLFEHLSIELNGKCITPPSNSYHYRSYIETLLNYSVEAKNTHLTSSLFYHDESGKMNDVAGSGFVARKNYIKDGAFELSSHIHTELTSQEKYLINNVSIRFKFYRSKSSFALMTTPDDNKNYRIDITDAVLLVRKVKINPSVVFAHEKTLLKSNIKMPINRIDLKTISIAAGIQTKSCDNVFIGEFLRFFSYDV